MVVKGCEECRNSYEHGCPQHRVQTICDKPVPSRAWATLPASYLAINKVGTTSDGSPGEQVQLVNYCYNKYLNKNLTFDFLHEHMVIHFIIQIPNQEIIDNK
jgi:hypothetical protein